MNKSQMRKDVLAVTLTTLLLGVLTPPSRAADTPATPTPTSTRAANYVWIEAEHPTQSLMPVTPSGGGNTSLLSGGKWVQVNIEPDKAPGNGADLLRYDFTLAAAGNHEVWARTGFPDKKQPFQWRLDDGAWRDVTGDEYVCDLQRIDFWCDVGWLKLGVQELATGKHTLQIRAVFASSKEADGKLKAKPFSLAVDAFCICQGNFRPNGHFKPDDAWQSAADQQAASQTFAVQTPNKGERLVLPLAGAWQVARADEEVIDDRTGPIKTLPNAADCYWMSITVPGDKNDKAELAECHRFFYRTRITVPADAAGKSFVLRFPCNSLITTLFVNGLPCGFTRAPYAPWDCDITKAVKVGQANEIMVGMKDTYYGRVDLDPKTHYFIPVEHWSAPWNMDHLDFPVAGVTPSGMLATPTLSVSGPAYVADVFAISSVKTMQLTLETTLQNIATKDLTVTLRHEIVPLNGTQSVKVFDAMTVTLPAGATQVVRPQAVWKDAKLWWPDDPQQYQVVTTVLLDGAVVDTTRTKFGFREWEWSGRNLKLNGMPFHGRADMHNWVNANPATLAEMKQNGVTMQRLWGTPREMPSEMVDVYDAAGMPVRISGLFNGAGCQYGLGAPTLATPLFAHWNEHLVPWVKEYRNHPSIFMWSIENEVTYINVRNFNLNPIVDPLMRESGKLVMATDPTRPVMVDGGRALLDNSLPVYGCHYEETAQRDYPDEAYTLTKMMKGVYTWQPWPIDRNKPILLGEAFFARGYAPSWYAGIMGPGAFSGLTEAGKGVGIFSKMLSEGYRWSEINFHFWHADQSTIYYNSWQPIALLCRQWNWTFGSGESVKRNLRLFNDTRTADRITAKWELLANGKTKKSETQVFTVAPGAATDWDITLSMPKVDKRTALQLALTCTVKGKEVFREVKDISVITWGNAVKPVLNADELLVLDPQGSVKARLTLRGIPFTEVKSFGELPLTTKIVMVGKDALTAEQAVDPKWKTLAAIGARIIVLEQTNRLNGAALPADLTFFKAQESGQDSEFAGRIAFPENLDHPVFAGLTAQDFFTWSNDHIVYRNPYKKASHGATSLVQCDQDLGFTALATCAVKNGYIMPCQLVVAEKLATNAVAQRLFDNMLNYAATYQPVHKKTAITMAANSPEGKMVAESGLEYQTIPDVVEAIGQPQIDIVIADADPATLAKLAKAKAALQAFTDRGGYLLLCGLTEKGLADFNVIVGVNHMIRPFEMEKVSLPPVADPLISGLTERDVVMESGKQMADWSGDKFMADDVFTSVVDVNDVAPFSIVPEGKYFGYDDSKPGWDHWPRNMFNGFVSGDSWKYCFTIVPSKAPNAYKWTMTYPQELVFTQMRILFTGMFTQIRRVNLYFDNDPKPFTFLVGQNWKDLQTITLDTPRKAKVITLEFPDYKEATANIFGIDNMWMFVKRPEDFEARVKPLLNIGALVRYPMGKGGVILNNLRIQQNESNPENAQKKRTIVATILRNLNATFSGGDTAAGADFAYAPVELGTKCNAFLTHDKGWPEARDLGMLPKGNITLAGVAYNIRDFTTSPLPSCIMLGGAGAPAGLPDAVTTIPVGRKVDALFFLHTVRQIKDWTDSQGGDRTPPTVFQYVIHYADGTTETVPVRLKWDVDNWIRANPQGGKNCSVGWVAAFPNDTGKDQAVLYQRIWANPRPAVEITSIDMAYVDKGSTWATPVLLGVTAATTAKK